LTSNAREDEHDLVNIAPNASLISLQNKLASTISKKDKTYNNKSPSTVNKLLQKPLIEQWLDDYWKMNLSATTNVKDTDKKIHILINHLLITGEEEVTGQYQGHAKDKILN
jgi:hypothetical protein